MPGWDRYDVPAHVQRAFDVPVLIDNDVNIMALGEQHAHLPDVDGPGLHQGQHRYRCRPDLRRRAAARRPGHRGRPRATCSWPRAADVTCRCGNQGCLEAVAAVPALADALRAAGVAGRRRPRRRRARARAATRSQSRGAAGRPRPRRGARGAGQPDEPVGDRHRRLAGRGRREPAGRHPRDRLPALAAAGDRAPARSSRRGPASGPASSVPQRWRSATCCRPTSSRPRSSRPPSDDPPPDYPLSRGLSPVESCFAPG